MKNLAAFTLLTLVLLAGCGGSNRQSSVSRGLDEYVRQARAIDREDGEEDGSVWTDQAGYADSFRDVKARHIADIVTVQVMESTSAVSEATTESAKSTDISKEYASLMGLEGKIAELPNLLDLSQSSEFSGDASTARKSVLSTTMTARVVEVFPNRNMLIEGDRELLVNGERQIVTLRGVIRPNDISAGNTVPSTRIAELEVQVTGHGIVSEAQEPGILYKVLSGFWPF